MPINKNIDKPLMPKIAVMDFIPVATFKSVRERMFKIKSKLTQASK